MKTKIKAEIVAHSLSPQRDELVSVLCTFPRILLSEVNTHRMLSKNTSSSRAIPFNKMVEAIQNDPFIPIAWQKDHKGMQGTEYFTNTRDIEFMEYQWREAGQQAIKAAQYMNGRECTKQLCNRLLEPFMWTTMLITGSREGWDNFFKLRCPQYLYGNLESNSKKDLINQLKSRETSALKEVENYSELDWLSINRGKAEIHMMTLAESIYDAVNESTPKQLKAGEWHIPFKSRIDLINLFNNPPENPCNVSYTTYDGVIPTPVKISTAMAARTSYTVVGEEKEINYKNLIILHNKLLKEKPPHSNPFEHCARAMYENEYFSFVKGKIKKFIQSKPLIDGNSYGWCYNLKGFISYRYLIDNNESS